MKVIRTGKYEWRETGEETLRTVRGRNVKIYEYTTETGRQAATSCGARLHGADFGSRCTRDRVQGVVQRMRDVDVGGLIAQFKVLVCGSDMVYIASYIECVPKPLYLYK